MDSSENDQTSARPAQRPAVESAVPAALADWLAAVRAPGSASELLGEAEALAQFRAVSEGLNPDGIRPVGQGRSTGEEPAYAVGRPIRRHTLRLAATGGVAIALVAGAGAAAAAGVLPRPLQGAAHDFFDAPPAPSRPVPNPSTGSGGSGNGSVTATPGSSAARRSTAASTDSARTTSAAVTPSASSTGTGSPTPTGTSVTAGGTADSSPILSGSVTVTAPAAGPPIASPTRSTVGKGHAKSGNEKHLTVKSSGLGRTAEVKASHHQTDGE